MDEEIKSVEELRKAQAAAQKNGHNITNYGHWESILEDLETAGIPSTGSYEGDVKLHSQIMTQIEQLVEQVRNEKVEQQRQPQNKEENKTDSKTASDKEQVVKANVVNATSSTIMANYMKYYHLLN